MTECQTKLEPRCDCPTCRLARIEASVESLRTSVDKIASERARPGPKINRDAERG